MLILTTPGSPMITNRSCKQERVRNLINFNYGSANSYWHADRDKVDRLSPGSFQIIGDVLLRR